MYSKDLKKVALNLYEQFKSLRKVANLLNINYSTISKWKNEIIKPRKSIDKILYNNAISNFIEETIKTDPLISLRTIQESLKLLNVEVCTETIRNFLKDKDYSKKKVKYYSCPKNYDFKLKEFLEQRQKYINENRQIISIDETSFGRNYTDTYGYSKKGEKIYKQRYYTRIASTTVIAASTQSKLIYQQIKGSCNSEKFLNFLKSLDLKKILLF